MPTVSVIVPTYKHRDYVLATLDSVFAQTFTDYELIVVNDGSPDDTAAVLKPLADAGRIRYLEQPNAGQASARNRGLSMASGEFVAFLDDDDLWPVDKLDWQVATLREHGGVAVGGTVRLLRDGQLEESDKDFNGDVVWPPIGRYALQPRGLFGKNPFHSPGQVLIRAEALRQIGGFDPDIWGSDDLDLWIRLANGGTFWHENREALHYRFHAGNASKAWERMIVNTQKVLAKNIQLVPPEHRKQAYQASQIWLYLYLGSERIQNLWTGRVHDTFRAIRLFAGPACRHGRLARWILSDLVPAPIRRSLRRII